MAVGAGAAVFAVKALLAGDLKQAGFLAIFAVTFGGMGFGMLAFGLTGRKRAAQQELLERQYPDRPWLWKKEWRTGIIPGAGKKRATFTWWFAIIWNAVSAPLPFVVLREFKTGNTAALLGLLFPLIGIGLLIWAVRETIRYRKFGRSSLDLITRPGVVGGGIRAHLKTSTVIVPEDGLHITLTCIRRYVTGSGKNRSTHETFLWRDEATVHDLPRDPSGGLRVPIEFRIPRDARPTDESDPSDKIIWRLEAQASVTGVDYFAQFEVPVFATGESTDPSPESAERKRESAGYARPENSPITVSESASGLEIHFPAARNPGAAFAATLFFAIWSGMLWLIIHLDAGFIFVTVFGVFEILLFFIVLSQWLGVTDVRVEHDVVIVRSGLIFWKRTTRLRTDMIERVEAVIGMRSGNNVYYAIRITGKDDTKVGAGGGVRDKREADWIAARIASAAGLADGAA